MKMVPVGHKVLIKVEQSELARKASGAGIVLTEKTKQQEQAAHQEALVVALGPDAYKDFRSIWAEPGDKVLVTRYSGESRDDIEEGFSYRIINDEDVLCKLIEE